MIIFGVICGTVIAIIIESMVLPALVHIVGISLTSAVLVSFLVSCELSQTLIIAGCIGAFMVELWYGLPSGLYIVTWLLTAGVWYTTTRIIAIQPLKSASRSSVIIILIVVAWIMNVVFDAIEALVNQVFFHGPMIATVLAPTFNFQIVITELIVLFFIISIIRLFHHPHEQRIQNPYQ